MGILRTSWIKSAIRTQKRRQEVLIELDKENEEAIHAFARPAAILSKAWSN
jgi:predicted 2-oxoglutarate/Fe(II)-dependent dioxygenase YbiX